MPTSRKKPSSGFATSSFEDSEKVLNISLDETLPEVEEEVVDPPIPEEPVETVATVEEIPSTVPTKSRGPLFIESRPPVSSQPSQPPDERRNIPKFSRMK